MRAPRVQIEVLRGLLIIIPLFAVDGRMAVCGWVWVVGVVIRLFVAVSRHLAMGGENVIAERVFDFHRHTTNIICPLLMMPIRICNAQRTHHIQ